MYRYLPGQFIVRVALALIVGACAAPDRVQVKSEQPPSTPGRPASSAQIVFGKLNLVRDGKRAEIERITTFGRSGMAALVLPEDSDAALTLDLDEQRWFSWPLKPGRYTLLGFITLQ